MQLMEELTLIQRGTRSIIEYLHAVKALTDEIAIIDHPISNDDLTLYVFNGLGQYFREIAAPIRARELSLAFEELHDLLVGHDAYMRRLEAATHQLVFSANFTKTKHSAPGGSQSWFFKKHDSAHGPLCSNLSRNFNGAQHDALGGPIIPIGVTSPNAKSVISWATLPSPVLNSILIIFQSIVLPHLMEGIKIGYLIRPLLIISRVIFPIYLFIPNMMELTK